MGTYKNPSEKAQYAHLKRDILGDGIKEGKLEKYVELKKYQIDYNAFLKNPTEVVKCENVLHVVHVTSPSTANIANHYMSPVGTFNDAMDDGEFDSVSYIDDAISLGNANSAIDITSHDLEVEGDFTYVVTEYSEIQTINGKTPSSTIIEYGDEATEKNYNATVTTLVLSGGVVTKYEYRTYVAEEATT